MMRKHRKNRRRGASITIIFLFILLLMLPSSTLSYSTNTESVQVDTNNNSRGGKVAPAPITNLNAENFGDGERVNLTWDPSTDPNFDHYNIYQNTTDFITTSGMKPINSSITDNSTAYYHVTGLTENEKYYFAVTAVNTGGEEDTSVKTVNITVKAFMLDIQPLGEPVSGNITIEVRVNVSVANTKYVGISIDEGQWMECKYNGFSKKYECYWDTRTKSDGEHTIDARATNKYDVTRNAKQVLVNVSNQHFKLNLSFGWNLITLPLNTPYEYAGGLANAVPNCTHIGKWNSTAQQFDFYVKNTDTNNFTLQNGIGYMVYTNTTSTLTLTGTNITTATIGLNVGWNSIGRFNITATTSETLGQNIANCTSVAYWNVTLGRFIVHPINTVISDFAVERGCGYFVYVTNESIWTNQ